MGEHSDSARKYWAFISYSHTDERVAAWLHRKLETYRLPRRLRGQATGGVAVPERLFPIFRDREELASADSLGHKITTALSASRALIVLASPASANSHWVDREIRHFKSRHPERPVLCLILSGEPGSKNPAQECFVPALRQAVTAEGELTEVAAHPIAADLRPGRDGRHNALLKLVAGLLDLGLDELRQRDLQRRNQRLAAVTAASMSAATGAIALAALAFEARNDATAQRQVAEQQRNLAQARQQQAEDLIGFMLGELREQLEPIGKLNILAGLGDQALAYFEGVDASALSDRELAEQARALRQIGDVQVQQGKLGDASKAFAQALKLDQEQALRHPNDQQVLFNIGQSQFYVGYDRFLRADYDAALPWFEAYLASAERLLALAPDNLDWQREKHYALDTMATVQLRRQHYDRCLALARQAEDWALKILAQQPQDDTARLTLGQSRGKLGQCAWHVGDLDSQIALQEKIQAELQTLLAEQPDHSQIRFELAVSQHAMGSALLERGQIDAATEQLRAARRRYDALVAQDPSNAKWQAFRLGLQVAQLEEALVAEDDSRAQRTLIAALESLNALNSRHYEEQETRVLGLHLLNLQLGMQLSGVLGAAPQVSVARMQALLEPLTGHGPAITADAVIACSLLAEAGNSALPVCDATLSAALKGDAGRRDLVAQALRDARAGRADSAAARQLFKDRIHNAHWTLFQRRCQCTHARSPAQERG